MGIQFEEVYTSISVDYDDIKQALLNCYNDNYTPAIKLYDIVIKKISFPSILKEDLISYRTFDLYKNTANINFFIVIDGCSIVSSINLTDLFPYLDLLEEKTSKNKDNPIIGYKMYNSDSLSNTIIEIFLQTDINKLIKPKKKSMDEIVILPTTEENRKEIYIPQLLNKIIDDKIKS